MEPAKSEDPADRGPSPATILVVDDEPDVRNVLMRALQRARYRVVEASSGEAALALIDRGSIDLIIADIKMPGMGGLGLLAVLVERDSPLAGRLIVCTGSGDLADVTVWPTGSRPPILTKPCTIAELLSAVRLGLSR